MTTQKIIFGNAELEGKTRGGWILGHFMPTEDLRCSDAVEIKWAQHQAGEGRQQWANNLVATSLSILINGKFRITFENQEIVLVKPGDYALWLPNVPHTWIAEADSTILTVRWPSVAGDSINHLK